MSDKQMPVLPKHAIRQPEKIQEPESRTDKLLYRILKRLEAGDFKLDRIEEHCRRTSRNTFWVALIVVLSALLALLFG